MGGRNCKILERAPAGELQLGKGMTVSIHSRTLGHVCCLVVVGEVHYASFKIKKIEMVHKTQKKKKGWVLIYFVRNLIGEE